MSYGLGIDVGTTFVAAAVFDGGRAASVPLGMRAGVVETVVYVDAGGQLVAGERAEQLAASDPLRAIREFKRRVGDEVPYDIGGRAVSVEELFTAVLSWVVATVTKQQGEAPSAYTLTCPATWGDYRRELLANAAARAGIEAPSLLTEPEAAAIFYAVERKLHAGDVIGVYDFGGGTFDASTLRKTEGGFELIGEPAGDDELGGIDIDRVVIDYVASSLGPSWTSFDRRDPQVAQGFEQIRANAVRAKELLCESNEAAISVVLPGLSTSVRLTRGEFERRIRPLVDRTLETFLEALDSADVPASELQAALLVGGSSRIPLVAELINGQLGVRTTDDAHPKYAVCMGAAIAAGRRALGSGYNFVDRGAPPASATVREELGDTSPWAPPGWDLPSLPAETPQTVQSTPTTLPITDDDEPISVDVDLAAQGLTDFLDVPVTPVVGRRRVVPQAEGPAPVLMVVQPGAPSRRRRWLVGGLVGSALVAAAGVVIVSQGDDGSSDVTAPVTTPPVVVADVAEEDREPLRIGLLTDADGVAAGALAGFQRAITDAAPGVPPPESMERLTDVEAARAADAVVTTTTLSTDDLAALAADGVLVCAAGAVDTTTPPSRTFVDLGSSSSLVARATDDLANQGFTVLPPSSPIEDLADDEVVLYTTGTPDLAVKLEPRERSLGPRVYDCAATLITEWWRVGTSAESVDLSFVNGTPCNDLGRASCSRDDSAIWAGRERPISVRGRTRQFRCDIDGVCEEQPS